MGNDSFQNDSLYKSGESSLWDSRFLERLSRKNEIARIFIKSKNPGFLTREKIIYFFMKTEDVKGFGEKVKKLKKSSR